MTRAEMRRQKRESEKLRCHGQLKLLLIFGGVFENGNSKKMRQVWKVL